MALSKTLNDQVWENITKKDTEERRKLLEWQLQAREPICKFSDIKKGDHLVRKASVCGVVLYYHHFLCTGSDEEGRPKIIHYYNTPSNAIVQLFTTYSFGCGSALGQVGIIQEFELPNENFIASESELQAEGAEVERVVWPDELKRYPVEEVINRARRRNDEKYYHPDKNNCESFVMWCLCGLNISLQTSLLVHSLIELFSGIYRTLFQGYQKIPQVITKMIEKIGSRTAFRNIIDKIGAESISGLGPSLVIALIIEVVYAGYTIYQANEQWKEGILIESREKFIENTINALVLALSRSGSSIGAMFLGQCVIPIPFLGVLAGILVGHLAGKQISGIFSPYLAAAIDKCITEFQSLKTKQN